MLPPMTVITPLLLAFTGLTGCAALDPDTAAATSYVNAAQPLMLENSLLAERLLTLSAQVYNDDVPKEGFVEPWNDEIVPLAQHVHIQADETEVPSEWRDLHDQLVVIWSDRASAYQSMGEAILLADRSRWNKARELEGQVVKREEAWFQTANTQLAPFQLEIEQYP